MHSEIVWVECRNYFSCKILIMNNNVANYIGDVQLRQNAQV